MTYQNYVCVMFPYPDGFKPNITDGELAELENLNSVLLRLFLVKNDGQVSSDKLQRF